MAATPTAGSDAGAAAFGVGEPQRLALERALGSQYEVLRVLGQGGAGTVFLARERLLERLVAIKVLRSEVVSADSRERFVREARTAAKLMHPGIVPLYTFGELGDSLYYIMGFVEGESLEALLRRVGRLGPDDARRLLVEVADALNYAHRSGVVHRDVKPDNILIDRNTGRAVLTDFGIAKVAAQQSTLTATGIIVGTPLYMSPEQASGDPQIDGRSDVYALGVIGYRMLAGRLPFEGTSAHDVLMKHVTQTPPALAEVTPTVPVDLAWTITRCLEKAPDQRWPSAEALRQSLETSGESDGELPDTMEDVSGRAAFALLGVWSTLLIAVYAATVAASPSWRFAPVLGLVIATGLLAPAYVQARAYGLSGDRLWRVVLVPPENWSGWWPSRLRRAGDVWEQLPAAVRRYRVTRTLLFAGAIFGILPLGLILVANSRSDVSGTWWRLLPIALVLAVAAVAQVSARSSAWRDLAVRAVPPRSARKWLVERTWGSSFWRRPDVAPLLQKTVNSTVDTTTVDPYCISTPAQSEIPQGMFDHVDPRSPTPLYAQIASRLRVAIAAGELRPGDSLPSVRQLSGRLRINPATVVQAYRELEVEGLVSTRQGAGTFVQDVAADRRNRDREKEARRLVRDVLAQAGSLGITASELRSAMDQELKGGGGR